MSMMVSPHRFAAAGGDPSFASVVMLLNMVGANNSTTFTDQSPAGHGNASVNGGAKISTAQTPFVGGGSLALGGASDWLTFPDSADWCLAPTATDAYTIEVWVRWGAIAANKVILSQYDGAGFPWGLRSDGTGSDLLFFTTHDGSTFAGAGTSGLGMVTNTWYFIAADKSAAGKIRLYVNGVMVASATPANSAVQNGTQSLGIGATWVGAGPTNGHLGPLRITKGLARYASDSGHAVPTAAFPTS